jgi:hypothetical protein
VPVGHVREDNSASADHTIVTHRDALNYCCSGTNVSPRADGGAATDHSAGRDVGTSANGDVVFDDGSRVHNRIVSNVCPRVDDCPAQNLRTDPNVG